MDKIEVGEYVRLARCQGINKIIDIDEDGFLILDDNIADEYGDECCHISPQDADKEILKHSFNIINLIEVGDIIEINNEKYEVIIDKSLDKLGVLIPNKNYLAIRHSTLEHIFNEYRNIKILTHELYERNSYKVEGE